MALPITPLRIWISGLQELGRDSSVAAYSRLRNTNLSRYSHQRRQMAVVQITKEECNHKHCCHCRPANHLGRPVAATAMKANNALRRATTIPIFYSDCGNVVPEHNATGQQGYISTRKSLSLTYVQFILHWLVLVMISGARRKKESMMTRLFLHHGITVADKHTDWTCFIHAQVILLGTGMLLHHQIVVQV